MNRVVNSATASWITALVLLSAGCSHPQNDANAPIGQSGEVPKPKNKKTAPVFEASPGRLLLSATLKARCNWTQSADEDVQSHFNDGLLRVQGMGVLDRVADCLQGPLRGSVLTVTAHTDARGTGSYNQNLGTLRSKSVQQYLTGRSVAAARITLVSRAEPNQTEQGDATAASARNIQLDVAGPSQPKPGSASPE
ncbi:MAG: OmpA family protein [Polyangiaceae bacterium]